MDRSLFSRMEEIWKKGSILRQCQSPYHRHRWQSYLCPGWTVVLPLVFPFSQKSVKNMNPVTIERWDPLWEVNLTHCSCQVWGRHTYLWPVILHNQKKIYCKDIRNELKSYHNKMEWVNFVLMQDSWPQFKLDSASWRKKLKSGLSWVHIAKRRRFIWPEKLGSREHQNSARVGSHNLLPTT